MFVKLELRKDREVHEMTLARRASDVHGLTDLHPYEAPFISIQSGGVPFSVLRVNVMRRTVRLGRGVCVNMFLKWFVRASLQLAVKTKGPE